MAARKRASGKKTVHKKAARKKSTHPASSKRYGAAASKRVASAMRRRKRGTLKSGPGGKGGTCGRDAEWGVVSLMRPHV